MNSSLRSQIIATMIVVVIVAPSADADRPARHIDLRDTDNARIVSGAYYTSRAGDINGDGAEDLLVGDCLGDTWAGEVYVLYGPFSRKRIDLSRPLPEGSGFKIVGGSRRDTACRFSGAGDFNGDGLGDVLVGAPAADNNARYNSGSAYVVFGKDSGIPVQLRDFDDGKHEGSGVRIDGAADWNFAGEDVAGLGDVNGDGNADVAIGAPFASRTYVIFGSATVTSIDLRMFDLNAQGLAGYVVNTPAPYADNSYSVGAAGDANGDGFDDLVVGVYRTTEDPGSAFVVFGKPTGEPVDVEGPTFRGYAMEGPDKRDTVGYAVGAAGDVNADGLDDVIVGAPAINCCDVGHGYVIFGKQTEETISLGELGSEGIDIVGAITRDRTGYSVAGVGDLNRDGFGDVAIGAPYPRPGDDDRRGAVAVVYGQATGGKIRLKRLARRQGFWVDGVRGGDQFGTSVTGPGDLNGDGVDDLAFSAHKIGKTFVLFLDDR